MKRVDGWWISGHPGSPDPIGEQREHDVGVIETALPHCKTRTLALQAGARAGLWPFELSKIFERVIAFEPEPENWRASNLNLAKRSNVALYAKALGQTCRSARLKISDKNDGTHYLTRLNDRANTITVPVVTIDSLELEHCSAIFLDVEGLEIDVLKGGLATIQKHRPVLVLEENILCQRYGYRQGDLEKMLCPMGYDVVCRYGRIQPSRFRPFPGSDLIFRPS